MAMRQFSRLSVRGRVILIALAAIILPVELMMHGTFAREYYYLNVNNLGLVALTAVKMGAEYLPTDPPAAIRVADAYAQTTGSRGPRSCFTEPSSDGNVLTIRLERKNSTYLAVLAMVDCRRVISTSRRRHGGNAQDHPFGTKILVFRRPNRAGRKRKLADLPRYDPISKITNDLFLIASFRP